jgi:hypothetical protein
MPTIEIDLAHAENYAHSEMLDEVTVVRGMPVQSNLSCMITDRHE